MTIPTEINFEPSNNSVNNQLTISNILKKVPEITIWRYYIGMNWEISKPFMAPYRPDTTPSFNLYYDSRGRLMFKDFGRAGASGDIFNYLQMVERISFIEALEKVNRDFKLDLVNMSTKIVVVNNQADNKKDSKIDDLLKFEKKVKETQSAVDIFTVTRKWEKSDIDRWLSWGISQKTLNLYQTHCALEVYKNGILEYTYSEDNPCYVYWFPKTKHTKCYFPLSKTKRFFGNINNLADIQGYYQCDVKNTKKKIGRRILILTKAMKDVMFFREMGYDAMAIHGENHRFSADFIRHLKKYYDIIVSVYDRDRAGMLGAKSLWKEHKIKPFFINKKWKQKDITDMYFVCGIHPVKQFLREIEDKS